MHLKTSPSVTDSEDAIFQFSATHFHLLTGLLCARANWSAVPMLHKVSLIPGVHSDSEMENSY